MARRWGYRRLYELLGWVADRLRDIRITVLTARQRAYLKAFPAGADLKYHFQRVKIIGPQSPAKSTPGAFLRALEREFAQLRADDLAMQARERRAAQGGPFYGE